MTNLNCLVVDDEEPGRKTIQDYISDTEYLTLSASVASASKALDVLRSCEIDLLFLDIQMPRMSGIDFLKSLSHPPLTIMVTAHSEYALQGYELDIIDYLLKPISFERFTTAVQKARDFYELKNRTEKDNAGNTHFFIKCKNQYERIRFDDLLFVEAANNYVTIQTQDRTFTSYLTFKTICDHLPASRFIKVHKSFIVSSDKIDSLDGERIKIRSYEIPISRSMRATVLDRILNKNVIKR